MSDDHAPLAELRRNAVAAVLAAVTLAAFIVVEVLK